MTQPTVSKKIESVANLHARVENLVEKRFRPGLQLARIMQCGLMRSLI